MLFAVTDIPNALTWLAWSKTPGGALDLAAMDDRVRVEEGAQVRAISTEEPIDVQPAPEMDGATEPVVPSDLMGEPDQLLGLLTVPMEGPSV